VESKQSLEEQKVLQEAINPQNQVPAPIEKKNAPIRPEPEPVPDKKKKEGLFKRVFGKKEK
jgi:hypothetical protein